MTLADHHGWQHCSACLADTCVLPVERLCTAVVCILQLTHDGRWLTTTDGNTVRVWDAANLSAPVKNLTVPYPLEAASYCPAKVCMQYSLSSTSVQNSWSVEPQDVAGGCLG
jgi:hypothetical protein